MKFGILKIFLKFQFFWNFVKSENFLKILRIWEIFDILKIFINPILAGGVKITPPRLVLFSRAKNE